MREVNNTPLDLTKLSKDDLVKRLRQHLGDSKLFAKKSLIECISGGRVLIVLKSRSEHGSWLPLLAAEGIKESTAQRYIVYANNADLLISAFEQNPDITQTIADSLCKEAKLLTIESDDLNDPEALAKKLMEKIKAKPKMSDVIEGGNSKVLSDLKKALANFQDLATADPLNPSVMSGLDYLSRMAKAIEASALAAADEVISS